MLSDAAERVYASVFQETGKAYMQATSNVIDQEKMLFCNRWSVHSMVTVFILLFSGWHVRSTITP